MGGPVFNAPVYGKDNAGTGYGIQGESENENGIGVWGLNSYGDFGAGVFGQAKSIGVSGHSVSDKGFGVFGQGKVGVKGSSNQHGGAGLLGECTFGDGVHGVSTKAAGVAGHGDEGPGIWGTSKRSSAGHFQGNVVITGNLQKGGGSFKIDHPLYPSTKYLSHSFVESPDMKNIYDGVVTLDHKGESEINLPDWFGALNKDFRYQLTAIAAPGPNLHIAEEISEASKNYSNINSKNNNSRFKIAGGATGMKVSWQVTGIRKDPWANAHRIEVEEDKPSDVQGYYLHPEVYGDQAEKTTIHPPVPADKRYKPLIPPQINIGSTH